MGFKFDRQRHGMEVPRLGVGDQLIEIGAGFLRQLACNFKLDPARGFKLRLVGLEERFLAGVGVAHHLPGVACHFGLVDQNHAEGAFTGSFFVFVCPAAVIGEGAAFEEIGIIGRRLVYQHEQDLAANVHALVVVPFIFRGLDSVSDENDGGVYVVGGTLGFVVSDVLVERLELQGIPFVGDKIESGLGRRSDSDHGNFLKKSPVVAGRLQSSKPELGGDVFGGDVASALSGAAAFEKIKREITDVGADVFGVNFFERSDGGGREMRRFAGKLGFAGGMGSGESEGESEREGEFSHWAPKTSHQPSAIR